MISPLISIITPVYCGAVHITECIESVINQTYENWELIIVNDGSTDNTIAIIESLQSQKIKIFTTNNGGASKARNFGLLQAAGTIVQFLDADDILHPTKLEKQLLSMKGDERTISVCQTVHFENGADPFLNQPSDYENTFLYSTDDTVRFLINLYGGFGNLPSMIQTNAWLIPMSVIKNAGPWNDELTVDDDGEFFCRIILNAQSIICVAEPLNYYRKFPKQGNLSARTDYNSIRSVFKSALLKKKHLLLKTSDNAARDALALQFRDISVRCFPVHMEIHKQAEYEVEALGGTKYVPVIGGPLIEKIKKYLGWKPAKRLMISKMNILKWLKLL